MQSLENALISLFVMYEQPDDADAFMRHYTDVHLPLARAVPGVKQLLARRVTGPGEPGSTPYFLVAEMQFATRADFDLAMRSPENKAAGRDLGSFAKGRYKMLFTEQL